MAPIVLYYYASSGPCRAVLSTIKNLDLEFEIRNVDLFKGEQYSAEFVKINPQHAVPTLDDNGFILNESVAIAIYLVEKNFPSGHSLYPKCAIQRASINQKLQFNTGTLYPRFTAIALPALLAGKTTIDKDSRTKLFEAVELLNTALEGKAYVAGTVQPTIADLALFSSVATLTELTDLSKYKNIITWFNKIKQLPGSDENVEGGKVFGNLVKGALKEEL